MTHRNIFLITVFVFSLGLLAKAQEGTTQDPTPPAATGAPAANSPAPESAGAVSGTPATVKELGFKYAADRSRLEMVFDKEVTFEKNVSETDHQVVLDIKNAKIPKNLARRTDTSQFKSNIALISPYQSGDLVRVVLQLKDSGSVEISQDGKKLIAYIDNKQGDAPKKEDLAQTLSDPTKQTAAPDAATADTAASAAAAAAATPAPSSPDPVPPSSSVQSSASSSSPDGAVDSLDSFFQAQKSHTFLGKHIFLQLRAADLNDAFRVISEASEFNIVVSDTVKGTITMNLTDVPWDQALDLILMSNKLAAERQGNVLRVTTLEALTKEKEAEASAKKAEEAVEPLVVKIFPISYAKIDDLKKIMTDFMTKDGSASPSLPAAFSGGAAAAAATPTNLRGSIQVDVRTNSLIVRDTPSTIEKIKRIIKELDTETPQILIEAKFVTVSEGSTNEVDGRIFTSSRELINGNLSFDPTKTSYGTGFGGVAPGLIPNVPPNFSMTPVTTGGASLGFMPKIGAIPGLSEIGAFINVLESENKAKTISSPRIVTLNKEMAEISQGQVLNIPTAAGANSAGGFQQVNALLKLSVTPQITNEGSILMKLTFNEDTVTDPVHGNTATKKVDTTVNIDSGSTLVIGGIYQSNDTDVSAGIPFLRDLPIIGAFFGSKNKTVQKTELFIFLNPRILNEKESGIKSS